MTPSRLWDGLRHGRSAGAAFRGNYTPARRHAGGAAAAAASSATCASRSATSPGFNIGGGNFDIDFVLRGPELDDARRRYGEQLRERAQRAGRHRRPDTTLRLDRPELRVADRPRARGRPAGGHRADRHRAAADGGRRRGGLALPRPRRQRGLRRPAPPERGGPRATRGRSRGSTSRGLAAPRPRSARRPRSAWRRAAASCGSTTSSRSRRRRRRRASTAPTGSARSACAASIAPGYGLADRIEALRQATAEMNLPAGYTHGRLGPGAASSRGPSSSSSGSSCSP